MRRPVTSNDKGEGFEEDNNLYSLFFWFIFEFVALGVSDAWSELSEKGCICVY